MIKTVQSEELPLEMRIIPHSASKPRSTKSTMKRSSLYRLDPFIDEDGILRVGGRLHHANQSFDEKHPAILPKGSHLAKMAIDHNHESVHHQGRQITHGKFRKAGIWIVGASRMISKRLNQCVVCRRFRGNFVSQHMADVPKDRLETPAPFTNVGFDVFGPWSVQRLRGGVVNCKRWGLIFTCLNCRAVHIEVLESMDSSSLIRALRRFFAMRGPPSLLRCDRGTNFTGGKAELDEALKAMDQKAISKYVTEQNCEWFFNPPHASHFGGA